MSPDERARCFEELYAAHAGRVWAFARRRTRTEAADVVAETFLVAWRRFEDVPADPLPWLLGIARNVLLNSRRSSRRRLALVDRLRSQPAAVVISSAPDHVEGFSVLQALARLSSRDAEVLALVAWDGLNNVQAASVLGCTPAAFAVRLYRARARLSHQLDGGNPIGTAAQLSEEA